MSPVEPVRSLGRLTAAQVDDVLALARAAAEVDGVYPLAEDVVLRLRAEDDQPGHVHLLAVTADGLAGYAYLDRSGPDGAAGELVVRPSQRRLGHGTSLLAAAGAGPMRFWAHGDESGAHAFALRTGFARTRVLWQMRRSLVEPLPEIGLPAGVSVRGFRPGAGETAGPDEQSWLAVNARAFAHHPEQGRWTLADLRLRENEPWFDPAGFLLAVDQDDTLLGFHWTKVHIASGSDPAIGEIYVLGVDPAGHRRGLGASLSIAGLRYLAERGLTDALLYVDESNAAAAALYRRIGFTVYQADVSYQRD